ncbi:hypothetical protein EV122DRAFT_281128 [Schizophyllum commune]
MTRTRLGCPKKAEALDAPRVLDALETPDALEKPGALLTPDVLGAPEGQRTLEAPDDPGTLKRDPAREADVPDALSTLVLPFALGMPELSATLDMLELPDTLDTLGTPGEPNALLDDVSMALLVVGCFVMVMGTATTAVKRAMRAIKRMVCYRMLIDRPMLDATFVSALEPSLPGEVIKVVDGSLKRWD